MSSSKLMYIFLVFIWCYYSVLSGTAPTVKPRNVAAQQTLPHHPNGTNSTNQVTGEIKKIEGEVAASKGAIVGGLICTILIFGAVGGVGYFMWRKRNQKPEGTPEEKEQLSRSASKRSNISRRSSRSQQIQ